MWYTLDTVKEREVMSMKYEVVVGGTVVATFEKLENAERELDRVKHSIYAMVHPVDCMFIRKKVEKKA